MMCYLSQLSPVYSGISLINITVNGQSFDLLLNRIKIHVKRMLCCQKRRFQIRQNASETECLSVMLKVSRLYMICKTSG